MASDKDPESIEVELILEGIHTRYGYDLRGYNPESIHRRVLALQQHAGVPNLGELLHRLLVDPDFFASSLDDLMVQVSDMFRDPDFFRAFRERVVPLLRTYPQLKIWHAGCSSGEEVYATAILLLEEGLYERSQIYATDISPGALERAREGVYSESQATTFAKNHERSGGKGRFDDYFTRAYRRVAVRDGLRKNVVFFQHNLAIDHAPGQMHVVFCRNVLIYFGPALRDRVFGLLAESLGHGGFLCLGGSEALSGAATRLFADFAMRERIYRRKIIA
jgi:chemotaxis protein methyltransferase CheR